MMNRSAIKSNNFLRAWGIRYREWRSKKSFTTGTNNKVVNKGIRINTRIQIAGDNNIIEVAEKAVLINCLIKISGDNCKVSIGEDAYLEGAELWIEDNENSITVGPRTYIGHHTHIACTENKKKIDIGGDSMISSYVQIRSGDSHSILDSEGKRINLAGDVKLEEHCWIGQGATLLKGTAIDKDSVVATKAVVSGRFPSNVLIAGIPAKIIKTDINWSDKRIND